MKRPVIVLKTIIFPVEGQEKLEHELLEIVRRQYDTGVIVLPNWAEYCGTFEQDFFEVRYDGPLEDVKSGGQGLSMLDPRNAGGGEGLIRKRKG